MNSKGNMTAVEWYEKEVNALIDKYEAKEISKRDFIIMKHNLFYHAKAMEKEQIIDFHVNCMEDGYNIETEKLLTEDLKLDIKAHAEQYFNKTFKSE